MADSYFEAMLEFMSNTGFYGLPAYAAMQDYAIELGLDLDWTKLGQLGEKAAELARDEHERLMGQLQQLWNEWGGMTRLLQGAG